MTGGGLVFEAHRLVYHSTLGLGVIKKKKKKIAYHVLETAHNTNIHHTSFLRSNLLRVIVYLVMYASG